MVHFQFLFSGTVFIWFCSCVTIDQGIKSRLTVIFPHHCVGVRPLSSDLYFYHRRVYCQSSSSFFDVNLSFSLVAFRISSLFLVF